LRENFPSVDALLFAKHAYNSMDGGLTTSFGTFFNGPRYIRSSIFLDITNGMQIIIAIFSHTNNRFSSKTTNLLRLHPIDLELIYMGYQSNSKLAVTLHT